MYIDRYSVIKKTGEISEYINTPTKQKYFY